jgi:hypothetical protein
MAIPHMTIFELKRGMKILKIFISETTGPIGNKICLVL